jgi:hypothetical protein
MTAVVENISTILRFYHRFIGGSETLGFLAIHNKSNQIIAIYKEMLPRQLWHFLGADDNPGKKKSIMLRFGVMMFWLPKYEILSSFFLPPRKS